MLRNLAAPFLTGVIAIVMVSGGSLVLSTTTSGAAGEYGSKEDARAMLQRAVAAVKENKAEALAKFNKGEGGFKDRDLYVFCANASDGVLTAHPYLKGENLKEIVGKNQCRTPGASQIAKSRSPGVTVSGVVPRWDSMKRC